MKLLGTILQIAFPCILCMSIISCIAPSTAATAPASTAATANTLVYSVTVPADLEYQIKNGMYENAGPHKYDKVMEPAGAYLAYHRGGFVYCISIYLRGDLDEYMTKEKPMEQMMCYEYLGREAGFDLAHKQLIELEKHLGKDALVKMLKEQGYPTAEMSPFGL